MRFMKNLSFKRRIWLSYIVLIMTFMAAAGTLSYEIAAKEMKRNALTLSQDTLRSSAQVLDEKLRRTMVTILSMMISDSFKRAIEDASLGNGSRYYTHLSALETVFQQAKLNEPLIHSILVITPIGNFYSMADNRRNDISFFETDIYERAKDTKAAIWIEGHEDPLFAGGERVITLVMRAISERPIEEAYIVVNLREEGLTKQIAQNVSDSGMSLYFTGNDGTEVMQSSSRTPLAEHSMNEKQYLINEAELEVNDWKLIGIQSMDELLSEINAIRVATLLLTIACILLAFIISNVLTGFLLRPLHKLQSLMSRVGDQNLDVRFQSEYEDEVSQVGARFNRMLEQLQQLIADITRAEQGKRQAEIKALSAQIDPHFLYNTLNVVFWKMQLKRVEDAKEMVLSLSKLFQLGLNKGNEITTLSQEIAHVEHYLKLQKLCYEELFDYSIQVEDDSLLDTPILRVLLQPIVENAILHGLKDRQEGGFIAVTARRDNDHLVIIVEDNGSGMDASEVSREMANEAFSTKGYALRNVYQRLKLFYDSQAEVHLESEPNVRTAVTLLIPLERGAEIE